MKNKVARPESSGKPKGDSERGVPQARLPFPIVGFGASAGGLEALSQVLLHLPAETGMAFILVQHLAPKHESALPEILGRITPMPVSEVQEGMEVRPNHVYVIPPGQNLAFHQGVLRLLPPAVIERMKGKLSTIDYFFQSLAEEQKERVIGIILSGNASDGSAGFRAIKAEGGITIAQQPDSAKHDGMPRSAIASGFTDLILKPEEIAQELTRIAGHPYITPVKTTAESLLPEESTLGEGDYRTDRALNRIFIHLRNKVHVEFSDYKQSTVRRRIQRRMVLHKAETYDDYIKKLQEDPEEVQLLYNDILIHVTGFFRDPEAFNALKTNVLPTLLKDRPKGVPFRVWVPGCSTGEEVYSIAICIVDFLGPSLTTTPIQIFGSDISENAIQKARLGEYPEAALSEMPKEYLDRFFVKNGSTYKVVKLIRELCLFSRHDVTADPPFAKVDLLSCRNLLIYFSPTLQRRVIPIFHYALNPGGFLWLGRSETIGPFSNLFTLLDKTNKIFAKKFTQVPVRIQFPAWLPPHPKPIEPENVRHSEFSSRVFDLHRETDRVIQSTYGPPSVVINDEAEIQQVRGRISPFIEVAQGQATHNLFKMIRPELLSAVRLLIQSAKKHGLARQEDLRIEDEDEAKSFNIQVSPIKTPPSMKERYFLIVFENVSKLERSRQKESLQSRTNRKAPSESKDLLEKRVLQLEQELAASTEYAQSIIEEYETTQEELTSSNEELQSANEELQSTNEELETAKEELQSSNEELSTVNDELQSRNNDLTQVNNDLANVLGSVEIPIIIIGSDRKIRRFTPEARRIWNLIDTDVGRSINDIKPSFTLPDLESLLSEVIERVATQEVDVRDRSGHWYRLQIRPYQTAEKRLEGAVLSLQDIDTLKRTLDEVRSNFEYVTSVVETVQLPLVVLDENFKVRSLNRSFFETFGTRTNAVGSDFFQVLDKGSWEVSGLRAVMKDVLLNNQSFKDFELQHHFKNIGKRILLISGRKIPSAGSHGQLVLLAIEDITERRRIELALLNESADVKLLEAVAFAASETTTVEATLQVFLERICEYTGWPIGHAYFCQSISGATKIEVVPSRVWHLTEPKKYHEFREGIEHLTVPPGKRLPGQIVVTGKPAWMTGDLDPVLVEGEFAREAGIKAVLGFPVLVGAEVVAVLEFFSKTPIEPDHRLLEVMARIGPQLGRVIERKRNEQERIMLLSKEQKAHAEAEEANRAKDVFLATLSHELRTPLTTILTWSQLILMKKINPDETRRGVEAIEQSAKTQNQLIEDLLDVSRIVMGKVFLTPQPVEVVPIVQGVVDSIRPLAEKKSLELHGPMNPGNGKILADPVRLKQILWNLLSNAIKFTPSGGKIEIQIRKECKNDRKLGEYIIISVADTGIGIGPEFLAKVFDSFAQADHSTARVHGGLGLGLAIVRSLVELQNGSVEVYSAGIGKGATFSVKFPVLSDLKSLGFRFSNPEGKIESEGNQIDLKKMRVLIVDDESSTREAFKVMLTAFGAEVVSAASASEALECLRSFKPEILLSDIGMPEEDGYSLIRKVRTLKSNEGGNIPAIALTAFAGPENRDRALAEGFQMHLAKPVDPNHLVDTIVKLVKQQRQ